MNHTLSNDLAWRNLVTQETGCTEPEKTESVQSLWSGFGEIFRVVADGKSLIVKHVTPPDQSNHPRGWSSDFATRRKLTSYAVETNWYRYFSKRCNTGCAVPEFIAAYEDEKQRVLLLEDLDAAGYSVRYHSTTYEQAFWCVDWLARFHACFMGTEPVDLWPVGTYWHLATRPDEYKAMAPGKLKEQAENIDQVLNSCTYQTLVHGDAKLANFCFSQQQRVAAVDFQYVGGGCGMKDLAYLLGSCFDESECDLYADSLLDRYFDTLRTAVTGIDVNALECEWRAMYPLAWTDFYRFLAGWMPTHQKIHRYTRQMAEQTFDTLPTYLADLPHHQDD